MSQAAPVTKSRITIDCWRNTYVVSGGPLAHESATHDWVRRINRQVAEELPAACARQLGSRINNHAGSAVWLIRELNINFTVDVSNPSASDIAMPWSEIIALRLEQIIERGEEGEGVLRFADRAAYQAQFACDLAAGRAWSKWYYQEFHSLTALTTSRAIREMLTREPEQGMLTLVHLDRSRHLDEVLFALTDLDAEAVYQQCFGGAGALSSGPASAYSDKALSLWSGRFLEIWDQEPVRPVRASPRDFHDALRWMARMAARFPDAESVSAMRAALDGLLELRRVLAEFPSALAADRLVRDLVQQKLSLEQAIAAAFQQGVALPEWGLRFLLKSAEGDSDWAQQAAAVLLKEQQAACVPSIGESLITGFGGIFLVGPALVHWNPVLEMAVGERAEKQETASFLRYLILAKCLGSTRTLEVMADPALRLLSGCYRANLADGRQTCELLDFSAAQKILLSKLAAMTDCEGRCLLVETVSVPSQAKEVILLRDLARDEWIYGAALPRDANWEEALVSAIQCIRETTGNVPHVLLRPVLAALAESQALRSLADRVVIAHPEETGGEVSESLLFTRCISAATPQAGIAHLLRPCDQEFAYLSCVSFWPGFDIDLDLFGTLIARVALKQFARRLMGFQSSSPDHLCRNFLEGLGTVHDRPERIEVELPRPPLYMVLQLSGLARQTYTVPWLEGREVCLLPPGE